jgi:hypothetical protein
MARKYLKRITMKKAIKTGTMVLAAFAVGVGASEIPTDPEAIKTGGAGLALAIIMATIRAYNNMKKHDDLEGNPLKRTSYPSGYMWLAALAIPVAAMSACVTTTHPDGTITQAVDIDTAWAIYERYQMDRARLESEKADADAARRAEIERDLARLAPLAERAWRDIVRLGGS